MLKKVDIFQNSFEVWNLRDATPSEISNNYLKNGFMSDKVEDKLLKIIQTPIEAAIHIAENGMDPNLQSYINSYLDKSKELKVWFKQMPKRTPKSFSDYQKNYPHYDLEQFEKDIDYCGIVLPKGQYLFHGGKWTNLSSKSFTTNKPFSTSFCPEVALRNAEHRGKAFKDGRIDLYVLKVTNPRTKVFIYKRKGTKFGYENEVVFAPSAVLTLISEKLVRNEYPVSKIELNGLNILKNIPLYVLEVEIS